MMADDDLDYIEGLANLKLYEEYERLVRQDSILDKGPRGKARHRRLVLVDS